MRIEAYTQVQQLYQSQKLSRTQKTKTATHTDRLQISSQGKDFQTAKAAVAAAPDRCIRQREYGVRGSASVITA